MMKKLIILPLLILFICGWSSEKWGDSEFNTNRYTHGEWADSLLLFHAPLTHSLLLKNGSGTANFTRSTTATVKDYNGNVVTCAIDEPRFQGARRIGENNWSNVDTNGNHLSTLDGILIEHQKTNLVTYSEALDNATGGWTENLVSCTLNFASAPDGATTATKIIPDAGTGNRGVNKTLTLSDDTVYTCSVFAKANDYNWIVLLNTLKDGTIARTWFDLSNGVKGNSTHTYSRIESFADSWYRVSVGIDFINGGINPKYRIRCSDGNGDNNATGDGSKYNLFWGAQVEESIFASSYIKTVASQVVRNADVLYYPAAGNYNKYSGSSLSTFNILGFEESVCIMTISDNTSNNYIRLQMVSSTSKFRVTIQEGGASQAIISDPVLSENTSYNGGATWIKDNVKLYQAGSLQGTDTSADIQQA